MLSSSASGYADPAKVEEVDRSELARRHLMRGVELAKAQRLEQALEELDRAVAFDPNWIMLHYNRAIIYSRLGLKDREEADYRRVIALSGQASKRDRGLILAASYYNLVFITSAQGDLDQAFAYLDKALALAADINLFYHELVDSRELRLLRADPRFSALMRRYWPNFGAVTGRLPAQPEMGLEPQNLPGQE